MKPLPSVEGIRKKFQIKETTFPIRHLDEFPDPKKLLKEGTRLQKKGFFGGLEVWTKRTIGGNVLLEVTLVSALIREMLDVDKYGYFIYAGQDQIATYIKQFASLATGKAIGFLVQAGGPPTEEDKQAQAWVMFPTGTSVYPVSESWTPG